MVNLNGKQLNPSQGFLLVRHAQDEDTLTTELDQRLMSCSFDQIKSLASRVKNIFSTDTSFTVMYGSSKRTSQTGRYLAKILSESRYTVILEENTDIKEFYQGQFRVDHSLLVNGKYAPLETAWKIFNVKVVDGDIYYKFGDPIIGANGKPTFPLLQNFFIKYGETQADFLFRINRFISRISSFNRLRNNHLCVIVTHQAVASRIQREVTGSRLQLSHCEEVFVPYP